jgi:hypothetical protein
MWSVPREYRIMNIDLRMKKDGAPDERCGVGPVNIE